MSTPPPPTPVPRALRFASFFLSLLLASLFVWLLGFVLNDIDDLEGPAYRTVEAQHVDPDLTTRERDLSEQINVMKAGVRRQEELQDDLRRSMENAKQVMQQMMDLHRLALEQELPPTDADRSTLAEAQQRFLDSQAAYEAANARITTANEQLYSLGREVADVNATIREQQEPARDAYDDLNRAHRFRVASFKLAFIVPLFLLSAWGFARQKQSPYRPILLALLSASFWKLGVVMHEHFPREFFKYIAIVAAIVIVLGFLVWVVRKASRPDAELLIARYREAYRSHLCPACAHPIARGPLRFAVWTRKGPRLASGAPVGHDEGVAPETPYSCPSCGTTLFEPCGSCGAARHALLPFCEGCGDETTVPIPS